jgi:hypothetical protein
LGSETLGTCKYKKVFAKLQLKAWGHEGLQRRIAHMIWGSICC